MNVFFQICEKTIIQWDYINSQLAKDIKKDIDNILVMNDYTGLLEYFTQLIKPTQKQKKQTGEVFTPLELVNEMLDKLPEDVWSNPNLKWLDPANGIGNFPVCVFIRLMKGLTNEIPDETKRKEHILTKMIYACELDAKNSYLYKAMLGQNVNLYQGDSLKVDLTKYTWQNGETVSSFDIVMGNPPYQDNSGNLKHMQHIYR